MQQLQSISFQFPTATDDQTSAFADLSRLASSEALSRGDPIPLLPRLEIAKSRGLSPSLVTDDFPAINFVSSPDLAAYSLMSLHEVCKRFQGHVLRVDHMGVNFPADDTEGQGLLALVSQGASLYRYPSGEPWYFAIPSTTAEFHQGISDFSEVRFPKFELVLEGEDSTLRIIQIDFATDLTRIEVEERLPAPYGVALPHLDEYFRSVYVKHPWGGFLLRMDFRYSAAEPINEWTTCQWLIKEGKRYNQTGKSSSDAPVS
jgi:hypothetical protein